MPARPRRDALQVMGVVNVTDDSFSDGGLFLDRERAVEHGLALAAQGAAIVDVGGESTRPGATRVGPPGRDAPGCFQWSKSLPSKGSRSASTPCTPGSRRRRWRTAHRSSTTCPGAGPTRTWSRVVADAGVPWVLMHWRSVGSDRPHEVPAYGDVVGRGTRRTHGGGGRRGARRGRSGKLIIDPGLGFAKTAEHNWALLHALPEFVGTGIPVLVGASRKRFLGTLLAGPDGEPGHPRPGDRDGGDLRARRVARAWGVRVHDVRATVDALAVVEAWRAAREWDGSGPWLIESSCAA